MVALNGLQDIIATFNTQPYFYISTIVTICFLLYHIKCKNVYLIVLLLWGSFITTITQLKLVSSSHFDCFVLSAIYCVSIFLTSVVTPYNSNNDLPKIQLDEVSDSEVSISEVIYEEKRVSSKPASSKFKRLGGLELLAIMILSYFDYIGEVGTFIWLTIIYGVTIGSGVIANFTTSRNATDFRHILSNLIHSYNAILIIVAHWILVVHIGLDLVALTSYAVLMFFSFTFFPYIEHIVN
ncbi:putative integral membrane protein [Candida parapsilosis]|uniref:Uncharacterized protein n=2 Tax=Candida parapsilosis TaxID=5480 RepID=G8BE23_CANPC|nr:uncharacterized protein CPAR2_211640 [Candida parapsilosis]KAF6054331.1 putative integral membrane protein [Candida parapsilosis]KAF6056645.1 hypothetical protein FOB59_001157 [Candida parapsilosis]KAF6059580.1 putative integral membrane protein [Candida parapsilosis]KAF6068333.1 putative integral membrane protein [Candida parapsilosis]CAD1809061.1 unnamed protein product [Candida parapsilosis]